MRPSTGPLLGAAAIAVMAAAAWTGWPAASTGHAEASNANRVARGEAIYRQHCASCHGADLQGQPNWRVRKPDGRMPAPPQDESGHTWHHPPETLFRIVELGLKPPLAPEGYESDMPAFGEILSDEEIWAVLAFIESRWPPEIRAHRHSMKRKSQ